MVRSCDSVWCCCQGILDLCKRLVEGPNACVSDRDVHQLFADALSRPGPWSVDTTLQTLAMAWKELPASEKVLRRKLLGMAAINTEYGVLKTQFEGAYTLRSSCVWSFRVPGTMTTNAMLYCRCLGA